MLSCYISKCKILPNLISVLKQGEVGGKVFKKGDLWAVLWDIKKLKRQTVKWSIIKGSFVMQDNPRLHHLE